MIACLCDCVSTRSKVSKLICSIAKASGSILRPRGDGISASRSPVYGSLIYDNVAEVNTFAVPSAHGPVLCNVVGDTKYMTPKKWHRVGAGANYRTRGMVTWNWSNR